MLAIYICIYICMVEVHVTTNIQYNTNKVDLIIMFHRVKCIKNSSVLGCYSTIYPQATIHI